MRAYSQDLRDRILGALARGEGPTAIARRFEVSRIWVYQVRKRWKEEGQRHSLPMGGYRRSRIAHKELQIRQWIDVRFRVIIYLFAAGRYSEQERCCMI